MSCRRSLRAVVTALLAGACACAPAPTKMAVTPDADSAAVAGTALVASALADSSVHSAAALADTSLLPAAALAAPLPIDPEVVTGTLSNGLRYVIRANHKPEDRAELRLVVNAGSVLETEPEQGLAHFVEHMAFNGTRHFAKQELVDYLESIGMRFGPDLNAYTGFDETVYMLTVPTDSVQVMETAFQILEDWAHGVSFEDDEIDKERGVVIEEWRLGRGADQRMFDEQVPVLLHDSRYAERLPIGQKAVLDTFDHDTLRGFYRRWYRPDIMGFVAVGDFDAARVESLAVAYFGRLQAPATPTVRPEYPVPDHEQTLFAVATDPEATQNAVNVYYKQDVREQSTVGSYRQSLIEGLYHGMLNRRLYELTTKADPPFLGAASSQGRWLRTKEFFVVGAAIENNGFQRGLEALLTEALRVRRHGFTATELARQKRSTLRNMEQAWRERDKTPSGAFAVEYTRHLLVDEPIPGVDVEYGLYQRLLPTIHLEDVNALARQWTGASNRVIVVNAPEKAGVGVPSKEELQAVFTAVEAKQVEPYVDEGADLPLLPAEPVPGTVTARDSIPDLGVATWTLSNGIRLFLKSTEFKNDQILLSAYSPGGHSLAADADYLPAAMAVASVTQGGVGNFDQIGLTKWLQGKVVSARPYISELHEGMNGSASPEDAETLFQLIHAWFVYPRADSVAFEAFRTRLAASIENRSARPETAYSDTITVTMAQHHLRARPWVPEMVGELDLARSLEIYRERFADAGDFTFFLVGNFTADELEPLVDRYLASLPATGRQETWRDVGIEPPPGEVERIVRRGLEPKSRTRIVYHDTFDFDDRAARVHLEMMAEAFQIKLREVLREDLGGTYGVGVKSSIEHFPDEDYSLTVNFACDPERVDELTDVVYQEIDSLSRYGLDSTYVTKVKEARRREREINLHENSWWLSVLQWVDVNGVDPLSILDESLVEQLTSQDIQRAAQRWFGTPNRDRFVLLPGAAAEGAAGAAAGTGSGD